MQFVLQKIAAVLAHVNLGEEKHGDEEVLRYDLKLDADVGNDFLTQLEPTLKAALYRAEGESGEQAPLIDDGHPPAGAALSGDGYDRLEGTHAHGEGADLGRAEKDRARG